MANDPTAYANALVSQSDVAGVQIEADVRRRVEFIDRIRADLESRVKDMPGAVNPFSSETHTSLASQQLLEILQYADPSRPLDLREAYANFVLALSHIAAARGANAAWTWSVAVTKAG